jgi:hypothetical protein
MPKLSDTAVPSYRLHKQSCQAIVTRDICLGVHGTQASKDKYNRLVAEWIANGRHLRMCARRCCLNRARPSKSSGEHRELVFVVVTAEDCRVVRARK